MEYLESLIKQIREVGGCDTDSFQITANDGEPAIVLIRSGAGISVYVQNTELTKLELKAEVCI